MRCVTSSHTDSWYHSASKRCQQPFGISWVLCTEKNILKRFAWGVCNKCASTHLRIYYFYSIFIWFVNAAKMSASLHRWIGVRMWVTSKLLIRNWLCLHNAAIKWLFAASYGVPSFFITTIKKSTYHSVNHTRRELPMKCEVRSANIFLIVNFRKTQ